MVGSAWPEKGQAIHAPEGSPPGHLPKKAAERAEQAAEKVANRFRSTHQG